MRAWRSRKQRVKARLLCLHGSESHSGWFSSLGGALAARGIEVFAYDRDGWGNSAGRRGDLEEFQEQVDKVRQYLALLQGDVPVFLLGMSWGAYLALAIAMENGGEAVDRVVLLAPPFYLRPAMRFKLGKNILKGRWSGGGNILLPFEPSIFSPVLHIQEWIAADSYKTSAVTRRFLWQTVKHIYKLRRCEPVTARVLALFPQKDHLVDCRRSARFCQQKNITVGKIAAHGHLLTLGDAAQLTASSIADFCLPQEH